MPYLENLATLGEPVNLDLGFGRPGCACGDPAIGQPAAPPVPAGPSFRLDCGAGCHPLPAARCRAVLRQAIGDAIALSKGAAAKLEASPREADTVRKFRFFFGHDPSRQVPWAGNKESGAIVAGRLRAVAASLRSRGTQYRCGCPGAAPTVNARTVSSTEVRLCTNFWAQPKRFIRAGIILHEMLHQYFLSFVRHDANERRRDNAHCYEAFVMRVNGHGVDLSDVARCRARPA